MDLLLDTLQALVMASAQLQGFVDSSLENWSFHIQLSKFEELQTSRRNNKPLHLDIIPFFFPSFTQSYFIALTNKAL